MNKDEIFKQVVKSLSDSLHNLINSSAEERAILSIKHSGLSEDEVRNEAVKYFYAKVAKTLSDHLTNKSIMP